MTTEWDTMTLCDKHFQLQQRYSEKENFLVLHKRKAGWIDGDLLEIRLIKLVGYIPTQGPEFTTLLNDSMKKDQCKDTTQPTLVGLIGEKEGIRKEFVPHQGIRCKWSMHIGTKPLRRFVCHFDRILENRDGEDTARIRCTPQAIISVGSIRKSGIVANALQVAHPTECDVTVLQYNPLAVTCCIHDHLLCTRSLTLTQRNGFQSRRQGRQTTRLV